MVVRSPGVGRSTAAAVRLLPIRRQSGPTAAPAGHVSRGSRGGPGEATFDHECSRTGEVRRRPVGGSPGGRPDGLRRRGRPPCRLGVRRRLPSAPRPATGRGRRAGRVRAAVPAGGPGGAARPTVGLAVHGHAVHGHGHGPVGPAAADPRTAGGDGPRRGRTAADAGRHAGRGRRQAAAGRAGGRGAAVPPGAGVRRRGRRAGDLRGGGPQAGHAGRRPAAGGSGRRSPTRAWPRRRYTGHRRTCRRWRRTRAERRPPRAGR